MTHGEILEELQKCKDSPHYFATKYLTIKVGEENKPFTTRMTQEQFDAYFKSLLSGKPKKFGTKYKDN